MTPMDLLRFNPCNLDHLTETYNIGFYLEYFTKWPSLCKVIESEDGEIEAYSKCFVMHGIDKTHNDKNDSPRQSRVITIPSASRAV